MFRSLLLRFLHQSQFQRSQSTLVAGVKFKDREFVSAPKSLFEARKSFTNPIARCSSSTGHEEGHQGQGEDEQRVSVESYEKKYTVRGNTYSTGARGRRAGNMKCFRCGGPHLIRDCNQTEGPRCYRCGQLGHRSFQCKAPKQVICFRCGGSHYSEDCDQPENRRCYNCGQIGHISSACPEEKRDRIREPLCHRCGGAHHVNECDQPNDRHCFNCGEVGHLAFECPENVCTRCGEKGHSEKFCELHETKICYRCGEAGHFSRDCPRNINQDYYRL